MLAFKDSSAKKKRKRKVLRCVKNEFNTVFFLFCLFWLVGGTPGDV